MFNLNKARRASSDKFVNNLARTQGNEPVWFGDVEPQIDLASRVGFVQTDAHYVRTQFASAIVRRNVIAKLTDEKRPAFKTAA